MNYLANGCSYSDFNIFPSNWHTARASLKKKWRVEYRFNDPTVKDKYPKGYQRVLKSGVNRITTLEGRQEFIKSLITKEKDLLDNHGFNPIPNTTEEPQTGATEKPTQEPTETTQPPEENDDLIDPNTPFIEALEKGLEEKTMDPESKKDIKNKIPHVKKAADALKIGGIPLSKMPIKNISRKHIRLLLNQIGKNKGEKWTPNNFNRYRTDLSIIFKELNELEAMDLNPINGIEKRTTTKNIRKTLTKEERKKVDKHLKKNYPTFWRFTQIFYHSGCRETEMLRIEYAHVNLKEQHFTVLVKKGKKYHWDKRAINKTALPLWKEIMNEAEAAITFKKLNQPNKPNKEEPEEKLYLFSEDLKPMYRETPLRQEQISRRWHNHVKVQLGITADFYPLKHLRTTDDVNKELKEAITQAQKKAAKKNGHTTSTMVRTVYDVENKERMLEIDKTANNKFA